MTHWEFTSVVTMLSACDHPLEIKIETLDYCEADQRLTDQNIP